MSLVGHPSPLSAIPPRPEEDRGIKSAWAHERRRAFNDAFSKYLHWVGDEYPPPELRTINGEVLDLADIFTAATVQTNARLKTLATREGLSHEDFAVIAFNIVPGSPPRGLFHGVWLTTAEIASEVMDIYEAYILPIFRYWDPPIHKSRLKAA
ncbi:hypothetical protein AURDEDRAFT_161285 [Auricularia subglabra TFB-10046 SS5]|nr:hypothetical protein AURDEDRAFT_161285 [Auricularia subglabra TFB-10046 SS5]